MAATSRFLFDSNCWMEVVRSRPQAQLVQSPIAPPQTVLITDFALFSVALAMRWHKVLDAIPTFIKQTGIGVGIEIVRLMPSDFAQVVEVCTSHTLDFDDAYQYVAAESNALTLVSLDTDFDRTPRGRLTPAAALQRFTDEQEQQQP